MKTRRLLPIATWLCLLGFSSLLAACGGGGSDGVRYRTLDYPLAASGGSTLLTGVRGVAGSTDVYISGFYAPPGGGSDVGLVYDGPTAGGGTWHVLNYPSSPGVTVTNTALYGPNDDGAGGITVVGNYTSAEAGNQTPIGLLYRGPLDGSGEWRTIGPPRAAVTIAHSTMGGLAVGNYDTEAVVLTGKAFIYDIEQDTYTDLVKPGALSITAYGIWHNGGDSYTIVGGYTEPGIAEGYIVDWDAASRTASNWTSYAYDNEPRPATLLTHFEGITGDGSGGYNLAADALLDEDGPVIAAAFATVPRDGSGGFGTATWTTIAYPGSSGTSANTVYENQLIGVYQLGTNVSHGYVATVP